jgi:iron-sulfur cluster assembly protein
MEQVTTTETPTTQEIIVTGKAISRIRAVIQQEGMSLEKAGLRLGVQGGGCSGLSYVIRFEPESRARDHVYEFGDARVFVDPKSLIYLRGMTLDYEESLMQKGFVFHNPNAKKSCGCGTSFTT